MYRSSIFLVLVISQVFPLLGVGEEPDKTALSAKAATGVNQSVDAELRTLLKNRFEAAEKIMGARMEYYRGGRVSADDTLAAIERFAKAGLEYAESSMERMRICESALEAAK